MFLNFNYLSPSFKRNFSFSIHVIENVPEKSFYFLNNLFRQDLNNAGYNYKPTKQL